MIILLREGHKRALKINLIILLALFLGFCWLLNLYPFANNFYMQKRAEELTGKKFWSWKELAFDNLSVRGEGYTLYIYKFSEKTARYFLEPNESFFNEFPSKEFADTTWVKSPIKLDHLDELNFVLPKYAGFGSEIHDWHEQIRALLKDEGSYYSLRRKSDVDFYIVSPKRRLFIIINHNM